MKILTNQGNTKSVQTNKLQKPKFKRAQFTFDSIYNINLLVLKLYFLIALQ